MTTAKLRILELRHPLFQEAVPDQTDFFWVDRKPGNAPLFGLRAFLRTLRKLRRREYDLVSTAAPEFSPVNPRAFLTAMRDWRLRAPVALFAMVAAKYLHRLHSVPTAAIDVRDTFNIPASNLGLVDGAALFFKRELPADQWQCFFGTRHWGLPGARWRRKKSSKRWLAKLRPISLGCEPVPNGMTVAKTSDIFFSGEIAPNSTVRAEGIAEVMALRAEGYVVDIPEARMPREEFLRRLAGAWLAWSPAGFGWDCYRHYEAALVGTVPLINYPTLKRYQPIVDGEHCVFYPVETGGLAAEARRALADKDGLSRIAEQARRHALAHHTARARATYVAISVLGRDLDGNAATLP